MSQHPVLLPSRKFRYSAKKLADLKMHFRDNQVCVTIMDLSHLTQLPPAFMNETQKTVGLKAWMTCLSVEQVIH